MSFPFHPDKPDHANEVAGEVKKIVGSAIKVLYGGSVKPENVDALMAKENIDGALVGGGSLKDASFSRIVKFED